ALARVLHRRSAEPARSRLLQRPPRPVRAEPQLGRRLRRQLPLLRRVRLCEGPLADRVGLHRRDRHPGAGLRRAPLPPPPPPPRRDLGRPCRGRPLDRLPPETEVTVEYQGADGPAGVLKSAWTEHIDDLDFAWRFVRFRLTLVSNDRTLLSPSFDSIVIPYRR